MSYRDLRNFSESMRVLGYPKALSLESFREANFPLMEEVVRWLASRVDRDASLGGGSDTMEARVEFVTQAVSFFLSRVNVRLAGRKLYGADGWAVRELLKVCALLRQALSPHPRAEADPEFDVSSKLGDIKQGRRLATEITARGAYLYELLSKEPDYKLARDQALSRPLDMSAMEATIRRAIDSVAAAVSDRREQMDNVASSEAALDAKIERRRADLERAQKRLTTLIKIKPSYQGELTALEGEVEILWEQYVLKYRCVEALKHQLSVLETAQTEAAEEQQAAIIQLISKYETEDVLGKLSDSDELESSDEQREETHTQPRPPTRPTTRLRIKTGGAAGRGGGGGGGLGESFDDIRNEDDSQSESDISDSKLFGLSAGNEDVTSRWRGRPATKNLLDDDDFNDLIEGVEEVDVGGSIGDSSFSEGPGATPPRASPLSDNEF